MVALPQCEQHRFWMDGRASALGPWDRLRSLQGPGCNRAVLPAEVFGRAWSGCGRVLSRNIWNRNIWMLDLKSAWFGLQKVLTTYSHNTWMRISRISGASSRVGALEVWRVERGRGADVVTQMSSSTCLRLNAWSVHRWKEGTNSTCAQIAIFSWRCAEDAEATWQFLDICLQTRLVLYRMLDLNRDSTAHIFLHMV